MPAVKGEEVGSHSERKEGRWIKQAARGHAEDLGFYCYSWKRTLWQPCGGWTGIQEELRWNRTIAAIQVEGSWSGY